MKTNNKKQPKIINLKFRLYKDRMWTFVREGDKKYITIVPSFKVTKPREPTAQEVLDMIK